MGAGSSVEVCVCGGGGVGAGGEKGGGGKYFLLEKTTFQK